MSSIKYAPAEVLNIRTLCTYHYYPYSFKREVQMTRKGMLINAREIPLGEDWVYFEAVKPGKNSRTHIYMRHRCFPQKLSGVTKILGTYVCNNCQEEASKEIVDKATVLLKMRIL